MHTRPSHRKRAQMRCVQVTAVKKLLKLLDAERPPEVAGAQKHTHLFGVLLMLQKRWIKRDKLSDGRARKEARF